MGTPVVPRERIQAALDEIVRRLIAAYAPERIILFGSYVSGQPSADSDLDLLIVTDTPERFAMRAYTVRQLVAGTHRGIPFDPLVLTPGELAARLQAGDQFVAEIIQRGRVLYDAAGVAVPP